MSPPVTFPAVHVCIKLACHFESLSFSQDYFESSLMRTQVGSKPLVHLARYRPINWLVKFPPLTLAFVNIHTSLDPLNMCTYVCDKYYSETILLHVHNSTYVRTPMGYQLLHTQHAQQVI